LPRRVGNRTIVHVEPPQSRQMRLEPSDEVRVIPCFLRRPDDFGEGSETRKRHVLDLLRSRHVLRPYLPLRAEDVAGELRFELLRYRFVRVDRFDGKETTDR